MPVEQGRLNTLELPVQQRHTMTIKTNNPFSREFTLDDIGHVVSRNHAALVDFVMARILTFTPALSVPAQAAIRDQVRLTMSRLAVYNPLKLNYTTWPFVDATVEAALLLDVQNVLKIRAKGIQTAQYTAIKEEIKLVSGKTAKALWQNIHNAEELIRTDDEALRAEIAKAYAAVPDA